jgi:phosphoribosyl-AMP cyclohydrolase / phosphoribosyl-ATP pyrophosphohydrolase
MLDNIDFEKGGGLIPVVVQDAGSLKVLMLGYMNREACEKTISTGRATFFSRSRNSLWEKGETSGNWMKVKNISVDCDNDTILLRVEPQGPACHTGADTCFDERNSGGLSFLRHLDLLIAERKKAMPENSYTTSLFRAGVNKISRKVGEEAIELIIEAKDENNSDLFLNEAADLFYHMLVLLHHRGFSLDDMVEVLEKRHT